MLRIFSRPALVCAGALAATANVHGFALLGPAWPDGNIVMHLQLGTPATPLSDGAADWGAVAESALNEWNAQLTRAKFTVVRNSTVSVVAGNRLNNVSFRPTVYGDAFGENTLAVTLGGTDRATLAPIERDVIFNSNLQWDSYRGPLRGSPIDFRRVALHEFGHVLGLDHPDEPESLFPDSRTPQNVAAVMRSRISSANESLRPDDIAGIKVLYDAFPNTSLAQSRNITAGGGSFTITVPTTGTGPFKYFYYFRPAGSNYIEQFAFAKGPSYTIGSVQAASAGTFIATATSPNGAFFSSSATLTVAPATTSPQTSLANISTRGVVGSGNGVLIAGFVIGGTGSKNVLIRAAGPALSDFGVGGALADPTLTIMNSQSQVVAQSDNWDAGTNASAITAASSRLGAFAFKSGSRDAAVLTALPPGGYTAVVSGANNTTGIALVEVYDADPDPATARSRPLVNIATRGQVNSGDDVLIAGLVVTGPGPRTYLVRAVGPTLLRAPFNVSDALRDPFLQIFQGSTLLHENDDIDSPQTSMATLREAAQRVGAFPLVETRSNSGLDAAMLLTLQPGSYTAKVTGFEGATGVALIEIYEMP